METLQPTLGQLNPDDAILVRNEVDKKRLSEEFQCSFVFTIEEAKGLEFDTVFLAEFFKENQNLWNKVLGGKQVLKETEIPQLRLELNLLYVAITRARRILNIWETQLSEVWSQVDLTSFVQLINAESIREQRVDPTPQMWRERGFYYRDAGFYRQAMECFEKAGEVHFKRETLAKLLLQERKYSEAAEVFVELSDWQQAAQLFEKAKQWQKAADNWRQAGNSHKRQVCDIYALEAVNQWEDAAQRWEALEKFEEANRCWLKSSNENKKAEIRAVEFEQKGEWLKAFEQYELAGLSKQATKCKAKEFEKRKQWGQAAEQFELAGMPEKAEECSEKADNIRLVTSPSSAVTDLTNDIKYCRVYPHLGQSFLGELLSSSGISQQLVDHLIEATQEKNIEKLIATLDDLMFFTQGSEAEKPILAEVKKRLLKIDSKLSRWFFVSTMNYLLSKKHSFK